MKKKSSAILVIFVENCGIIKFGTKYVCPLSFSIKFAPFCTTKYCFCCCNFENFTFLFLLSGQGHFESGMTMFAYIS